MWSWQPDTLTPTGYGYCGGRVYDVECLSKSSSTSSLTPSAYLQPECKSSSTSKSYIDITGYGIRECISLSKSSSSIDIGRGLIVINEAGILSTDTNVLRFYGNTLYSDSTLNTNSDSTITSEACISIDGGQAQKDLIYLDTLNGGDSEDTKKTLDGGNANPC